jgi:hypothetical protein
MCPQKAFFESQISTLEVLAHAPRHADVFEVDGTPPGSGKCSAIQVVEVGRIFTADLLREMRGGSSAAGAGYFP